MNIIYIFYYQILDIIVHRNIFILIQMLKIFVNLQFLQF